MSFWQSCYWCLSTSLQTCNIPVRAYRSHNHTCTRERCSAQIWILFTRQTPSPPASISLLFYFFLFSMIFKFQVVGLWRGNTVNCVRVFPQKGVRYWLLHSPVLLSKFNLYTLVGGSPLSYLLHKNSSVESTPPYIYIYTHTHIYIYTYIYILLTCSSLASNVFFKYFWPRVCTFVIAVVDLVHVYRSL